MYPIICKWRKSKKPLLTFSQRLQSCLPTLWVLQPGAVCVNPLRCLQHHFCPQPTVEHHPVTLFAGEPFFVLIHRPGMQPPKLAHRHRERIGVGLDLADPPSRAARPAAGETGGPSRAVAARAGGTAAHGCKPHPPPEMSAARNRIRPPRGCGRASAGGLTGRRSGETRNPIILRSMS